MNITVNQLLETRKRRRSIVKTEMFDFSGTEFSFRRCKTGIVAEKLLKYRFSNIDPNTEYRGKNREMYQTVGEFFIMSSIANIFDCYTRGSLSRWLSILGVLLSRGFLTTDNISRVEKYISQKRIPVMLRCVIRIMINKYKRLLKSNIQSISSLYFHPGVDCMIAEYTI